MQQAEIAELQEIHGRHQAQMVETLRVMGDMRREMGDMQAKLLALREQPRRARQPGSDARVPDHQDAPRDADSICTRVLALGTSDTPTVARYSYSDTALDMRREIGDMQAKLLALREQPRRARQPGSDARVPDHQDAPRDADSHI
nr:hypothetical protein [Tanacetum cinerariifolium]